MTAPAITPLLGAAAKTACSETEADVNLMILDYLLYKATEALLAERMAEKEGYDIEEHEEPGLPLQMVDSFIQIFNNKHPDAAVPELTQYRLHLLKFTTLYTHRLKPCADSIPPESHKRLRKTNTSRAARFTQAIPKIDLSSLPLSAGQLYENRTRTLEQLVSDDDRSDEFYGTSASTSLEDLLPMFLSVSAARKAMQDWNLTPRWMNLAAEFMMQTVLEQYLIYGASGNRPMREVFGWGWRPNLASADHEENMLNELFKAESEEKEVKGWREAVEKNIRQITPSAKETFIARLQDTSSKRPVEAFDTDILSFIQALQDSLPRPLMAQLETEEAIEGLSLQETQAFKERVGLLR